MVAGSRDSQRARLSRIPVRHLGGAVKLEDAARDAGDGAACFKWHAAVPAGREIERNDRVRRRESFHYIAVGFGDASNVGGMASRKFAGQCAGVEQRGKFFDLDGHKIGGIFGEIGVCGEHHGDWLADVTHALCGENRLAVRIEALRCA